MNNKTTTEEVSFISNNIAGYGAQMYISGKPVNKWNTIDGSGTSTYTDVNHYWTGDPLYPEFPAYPSPNVPIAPYVPFPSSPYIPFPNQQPFTTTNIIFDNHSKDRMELLTKAYDALSKNPRANKTQIAKIKAEMGKLLGFNEEEWG